MLRSRPSPYQSCLPSCGEQLEQGHCRRMNEAHAWRITHVARHTRGVTPCTLSSRISAGKLITVAQIFEERVLQRAA